MTPEQIITLILGPGGALVIASLVSWQLWKEHKRQDAKRDEFIDRQLAINETNAEQMPILTTSIASAVEYMQRQRN